MLIREREKDLTEQMSRNGSIAVESLGIEMAETATNKGVHLLVQWCDVSQELVDDTFEFRGIAHFVFFDPVFLEHLALPSECVSTITHR